MAKTLLATHPIGRRPVLQLHLNEHEEAAFIATEIKHLVAATGGMLQWGDFVVLCEFPCNVVFQHALMTLPS